MLHLRKVVKKVPIKPELRRRKKIVKIRKTIETANKPKSWFSEKIKYINL